MSSLENSLQKLTHTKYEHCMALWVHDYKHIILVLLHLQLSYIYSSQCFEILVLSVV